MNKPHIVVVGSYATGLTMKVARIPCAGETLLGNGYRVDFGGKGSNQAVGCARLGVSVEFAAKIGTDAFGEMAMGLYRDERVGVAHVQRTSESPTGVGFIIVEENSGQNSIVIDPGANGLLGESDLADKALFQSASVILTQLEIPVAAAEAALRQGRLAGAITILNPAPVRTLPGSLLREVDVLTPNESEAKVLVGRSPQDQVEPIELARDLMRFGVKSVVMTMGERGALLIDSTSSQHFPAVRVNAVDTTGAGDAFNAGLATALAHGDTLQQAVPFAVAVGAMAVTKEGVIPSLPTRVEVAQFCRTEKIDLPAWLTSP